MHFEVVDEEGWKTRLKKLLEEAAQLEQPVTAQARVVIVDFTREERNPRNFYFD